MAMTETLMTSKMSLTEFMKTEILKKCWLKFRNEDET